MLLAMKASPKTEWGGIKRPTECSVNWVGLEGPSGPQKRSVVARQHLPCSLSWGGGAGASL